MTSMEVEKKAALEWFNSVLCNDEPENLSAEENRIVAYIRSLLTPPPVDGELAEACEWWKERLPLFKGCTMTNGKDAGECLAKIIQAATSQQARHGGYVVYGGNPGQGSRKNGHALICKCGGCHGSQQVAEKPKTTIGCNGDCKDGGCNCMCGGD